MVNFTPLTCSSYTAAVPFRWRLKLSCCILIDTHFNRADKVVISVRVFYPLLILSKSLRTSIHFQILQNSLSSIFLSFCQIFLSLSLSLSRFPSVYLALSFFLFLSFFLSVFFSPSFSGLICLSLRRKMKTPIPVRRSLINQQSSLFRV